MSELIIGSERFAVRDRIDEWALMKLAKSQLSDDTIRKLAGMYDFVNAVVLPEERLRLDEYLSTQELPEGTLSAAIGTFMREMSGRPTERPSSSPSGGPLTKPKSKLVSFSQGTVQVQEEESPPSGQSAAS